MVKCSFADNLNTVRNYDIGKIAAFLESCSFKFSNTIRDFDGTQRGAVRKCAASNSRNGIGDCDILKQYTFLENRAAKRFHITCKFNALQFRTIHEHLRGKLTDAVLESNSC